MIYFDNAATSGKKPKNVISAVENALQNFSANPGRSGHSASVLASEAVFSVREKIANFFGGTGPQNVVFTLNCTHSLNCVIKGVLKKGDHVIVSSLEHNAVMRPLKKMGNLYSSALVSHTDDEVTVSNFERNIRPNTKLVICTAASNVTGKILPIEKIGKLCRKRGILFCVDAAQIAGVLPINMKKMNIDFLCIAPHKGLYAPMGVGILICEKNIENTVLEGGTGTNSLQLVQPKELPEKLESGTINVPAIMGVKAGIEFVMNVGMQKIYLHEIKLIQSLYEALKRNKNIKLYTPFPKEYSYAPVLSFNYNGLKSYETAQILSDKGIAVRGGFHCAPSAHTALNTVDDGLVRVSVSAFNTQSENEMFLKVINTEKNFKNL